MRSQKGHENSNRRKATDENCCRETVFGDADMRVNLRVNPVDRCFKGGVGELRCEYHTRRDDEQRPPDWMWAKADEHCEGTRGKNKLSAKTLFSL